jgi:hypothetical protein
MRIAFLCGSQEAGRDGVGDYTTGFAEELRLQGHDVMVIGLRDKFVSETTFSERRTAGGAIPILRLPSALPWAECIAQARTQLDRFDPEWVSLQFVCYTFHPKGLVHGLAGKLAPLFKGRKLHIMFHELWIGGASWKHRLVGALQRHWIKRCVLTLSPRLIQTSMPFFRALLGTIGIEASMLPLPGSIPVNPDPGLDWFLEVLGQPGAPVPAEKRGEYLVGGFFGTIYPNWHPEPFFSGLRKVAKETGQRVTIFAAGRMGGSGEEIWKKLTPAYPDFHFHKLGELSFSQVSQYLQCLDFGIAATSWHLIGKSSATAAMLDHGLPVMVPKNDYLPRENLKFEPPADPFLVLADRDVSNRFLAGLPRRAPRHSAGDLATEFAQKLETARSLVRFGSE